MHKQTAQWRLSVLILSALAALSGCGKKNQAVELRLGKGGIKLGGTFRYNEVEQPRSLDPARIGDTTSHHIGNQIFQGLVEFNNDLKVVPPSRSRGKCLETRRPIPSRSARESSSMTAQRFLRAKGVKWSRKM